MRYWLKFSYLTAVYLFLYFPIAVLVVYSFNPSGVSANWQGFTWHWYRQLLENPQLMRVALNSGLLAVAAATAATVLGTLAAICLYRYQFYGKTLLSLLLFALVVSPEIVMAVGFLLFFAWSGIPLGLMSLLLAHTTFCMPFVAVTVYSRLISIDKNIIKVAKELGASEFMVFSRILLPLLRLNILTGWLLSFTLSVDDVMISFFLSGPSFKVLPLEIYAWVRLGVRPELNALCSVLLGVTLVMVLMSQLLLKKDD
jgi:spermidine/putrescine transport system permease protein